MQKCLLGSFFLFILLILTESLFDHYHSVILVISLVRISCSWSLGTGFTEIITSPDLCVERTLNVSFRWFSNNRFVC